MKRRKPILYSATAIVLTIVLSFIVILWHLKQSKITETPRSQLFVPVKIPENEGKSKDELAREVWAAENAQSQDFYGKIVDQYGKPVAGALVKGDLMLIVGFDVPEKKLTYQTQTSSEGLFEFTTLHGARLTLAPSKSGYLIGRNATALTLPPGDKTLPTNRAIFTMWKQMGAEPMNHTQFDSRIPYDGKVTRFDLFSGKKSDAGIFQIILVRNPLKIRRGTDHFAWSVKIEIVGGGLIEADGLYQNLAPEAGYQPTFDFEVTKDHPNWSQSLIKTFYVHTQKGEFGKIHIDLTTDSERPDTGISVETWLNPSGSRNLEYDPAKEIGGD